MQSYLNRAKKLDAEGMVRLRAFGRVLAAYVAPIYSGSLMEDGPTVIGLRTCELAESLELDAVVPLAAVLERIAFAQARGSLELEMPAAGRAAWAGVSPPRSGWEQIGEVDEATLSGHALKGVDEIRAALPESVGGPIAARIRGMIWGRGMDLETRLPIGAAFACAGLGFLTEGEQVPIFKAGDWVRLSAMHGHVVAREAKVF